MNIELFLSTLYWRESTWLVLCLMPLVVMAFNHLQQRLRWSSIASKELQPWLKSSQVTSPNKFPLRLLAIAWFLFIIALAGPRTIDWLPPEQQSSPSSLVVIIDFSASMNANDVYPNRRLQALQLLQQIIVQKPDHLKMGIVLFAGHAFSLMPPTLDKNIIQHLSQQLQTLQLPTLGNDLNAALKLASSQFKPEDVQKTILVLTDGDLSSEQHTQTRQFLQSASTKTFFVGFGGKKAVNLPNFNKTSKQAFIKHNGRPVLSALQSVWLQKLNSLENTSYQHFERAKSQSLSQIIKLKNIKLSKQEQQTVLWQEWFHFPLLLGIVSLLFSISFQNKPHKKALLSSLMTLVLFSVFNQSVEANNQSNFKHGISALEQQQYKKAQHLFAQTNSAKSAFGEGVACYRLKDFHCASRAFNQAAWLSKSDTLRAKSAFNLGNSLFFLGQYEQASVLYENAQKLGFDPLLSEKNKQFSDTMFRAMQKQIDDLKELYQRAQWQAAAKGLPSPSLASFISSQETFIKPKDDNSNTEYVLSKVMQQNLQQQLFKQLGVASNHQQATRWIQTEQVESQSTSQLLKRLFEMELAIPAELKQPQSTKGQRQW